MVEKGLAFQLMVRRATLVVPTKHSSRKHRSPKEAKHFPKIATVAKSQHIGSVCVADILIVRNWKEVLESKWRRDVKQRQVRSLEAKSPEAVFMEFHIAEAPTPVQISPFPQLTREEGGGTFNIDL